MTVVELTDRLKPYLEPNCFRLTKEERQQLIYYLEEKSLSPETLGKWIHLTYSPGTMMCTKGNPKDILNPFLPNIQKRFEEWLESAKQRVYPKEVSRTRAAMSLILAHGEEVGIEDALSQGSDDLIIYRVLLAAGSPLAEDYEEGANKVLKEEPWRKI